ncbi:MAG: T9SS type A sorting domain-containing protein [Prolixibacteraceae bacterium]|nr:T9SS type A sorting domain-containing protein [Prolixibacteraceae bacterium]
MVTFISVVKIPATVELDMTGGLSATGYRFHYFIPPVQSCFIGTDSISVKENIQLQHFNGDLIAYNETLAVTEQSDGWKYFDGYPLGSTDPEPFSELLSTRGYNIFLTDDDKITFKGQLNSLTHTFPLYYTTRNATPGWNLIGNPFPCSYDLQGIQELSTDENDGIDNTVYFTKDGDYLYWNVFTNLGIGWNSDTLPPMQGFFLHVNNATTLTFPADSKVIASEIPRSKGESVIESETTRIIRLELSNTVSNDVTVICMNDNATLGFDRTYDSFKLFGSNTSKPFINTEINYVKYAINSLKEPDVTPLEIPLKVTIQKSGFYYINITQFDNLEDFRIMLKHGTIEKNIQNNSTYSFYSEEGVYTNFSLIIDRITTSVYRESEEKIQTWYNNKILSLEFQVGSLNEVGDLIIYDLNGTLVFKKQIQIMNGNTIQFPIDLKTGIYLISIRTSFDKTNSKLIVY